MASLSTLNTAVIVQNGGSGSIGKLKDLLNGRSNAGTNGVVTRSNPDGLKALNKFNERMKNATERKEKKKSDHFSFLDKTEVSQIPLNSSRNITPTVESSLTLLLYIYTHRYLNGRQQMQPLKLNC